MAKSRIHYVNQKYLSWKGRNTTIEHLWQQNVKKLECISTQAVPVVVENGIKSLIINGLLDDGSTQTYLNVDIAA